MNINHEKVVRMKLYVVNEETETFDVIVGLKKVEQITIRICVFEYTTGILKFEIPKR